MVSLLPLHIKKIFVGQSCHTVILCTAFVRRCSCAGTFFVDGIKAGVGAEGIIRPKTGTMGRKLPMRERIVVMCRLGQGASSAVYKAVDLTDMRLVALKMIHITDK